DLIGIAGAAVRPKQYVGLELLAALERQDYAVVDAFNLGVLFVVAQQYAAIAQMIRERVDNLVIEKFQQLAARINQINLAAQVAKHRRVLATHHAGAIDRDGMRRVSQAEDR